MTPFFRHSDGQEFLSCSPLAFFPLPLPAGRGSWGVLRRGNNRAARRNVRIGIDRGPLSFLLFCNRDDARRFNKDVRQMAENRRARCAGFTVTELLVVMGIVSVLAGVVLPAVQSARESARRVQCTANLRQIGVALHSYHQQYRALPPGWQHRSGTPSAFGWLVRLLPYLEQQSLASRISFRASLGGSENEFARRQVLPLFLCPSDVTDKTFGLFEETGQHEEGGQRNAPLLLRLPSANYAGIFGTLDPDDVPGDAGDGTFLENRPVRFSELHRGLSHTIVVGERTARKLPISWLGFDFRGEEAEGRVAGFAERGVNHPQSDECEFDSRHPGGANFLRGDGSVGFLSNGLAAALYRRLAQRK